MCVSAPSSPSWWRKGRTGSRLRSPLQSLHHHPQHHLLHMRPLSRLWPPLHNLHPPHQNQSHQDRECRFSYLLSCSNQSFKIYGYQVCSGCHEPWIGLWKPLVRSGTFQFTASFRVIDKLVSLKLKYRTALHSCPGYV